MYQIPGLLKYNNLFHAFSTVEEGNMANAILGKTTIFSQVLKNRKSFLKKTSVPLENTICMWVSGSDYFQEALFEDAGASMVDYTKAVKTDALITKQKGLYLFLVVADCAPVILYDSKKKVLAVIHAGWKGTDLGIVKKVIEYLKNKFKCDLSKLIAGVGPMAMKDSFIKENPSQVDDPKWKPFLKKVRNDVYKIDILGLIRKQILDAGIYKENIFESGINTVKDERFFSHYRQKDLPLEKQGRFACVVGIN